MITVDDITTMLTQADAWSVTDEKKHGWQFYYIRHRLDQNRAVNTEHISVTVYRKNEDGTKLGSASQEIAPTDSPEEAEKIIRDLLERASYVQNPFYELRKPGKDFSLASMAVAETSDGLSAETPAKAFDEPSVEASAKAFDNTASMDSSPASVAEAFLKTMADIPETKTEDINSYEIFTDQIEKRLVTSTGIDITERYPSSMLEVVTNARRKPKEKSETMIGNSVIEAIGKENGQNSVSDPEESGTDENKAHRLDEIELYRMYLSGTCDEEGLRKDITKTLQYGKDRLNTVPTPKVGSIPVLFSTADSVAIYDYFTGKMDARQVYQKTSDWKVGKPIAENVEGDRITIAAKQFLPNSSRNFEVDEEGAPIRDEILLEEDTPKAYWGNAMYSSWLGLSDTFQLTNYEVSGGTRSESDIRTGRYLEVVEFSDFQVDPIAGNIFGEIRLGYLHDGEQVTAVSGGSVSGSMHDYVKRMYLSKETVQYDYARVPAVTLLMDVTVTGAE